MFVCQNVRDLDVSSVTITEVDTFTGTTFSYVIYLITWKNVRNSMFAKPTKNVVHEL